MMKLSLVGFATVTLFALSESYADGPKAAVPVGQAPAGAQVQVPSAGKPNVEQPVAAPATQPAKERIAETSVADSAMGRALDREESRKEESPTTTTGAADKIWAERPRGSEDGGSTSAPITKREKPTTEHASYSDVAQRTNSERHDRAWYTQRYRNVVLAGTGYYYLDGGYWYPARGYDADADSYSYDGPICASGDLTPDKVIARVQTRLQQKGYFKGAVDGVLGNTTRTAISNFQRDNKLTLTSAIDEPTVEALGLA